MQLFIKSSNKSKLQQGLDRERECESARFAVEELAVEPNHQEQSKPFGRPREKTFQMDLLSGWMKP